jgi:hypothetical protein
MGGRDEAAAFQAVTITTVNSAATTKTSVTQRHKVSIGGSFHVVCAGTARKQAREPAAPDECRGAVGAASG